MRRLGFLSCLLALSGAASSCADSNSSIFIERVAAPDDMCVVSASSDSILGGSWDVNRGAPYHASLVVDSTLRRNSGPVSSDPNGVVVEQIEVSVLAPNGSSIASYTVPSSGVIQSSPDGVVISQGIVGAVLMPTTLIPAVGTVDQVTLILKLHGHTFGGTKVESGEFPFPVSILHGELAWSSAECTATEPKETDPCSPGVNGGRYCP